MLNQTETLSATLFCHQPTAAYLTQMLTKFFFTVMDDYQVSLFI